MAGGCLWGDQAAQGGLESPRPPFGLTGRREKKFSFDAYEHDPIGAFEAAVEEAIELSEIANNLASALQLKGPGGWGGKPRETQRFLAFGAKRVGLWWEPKIFDQTNPEIRGGAP
jgi:hypothetical protein